MTSVPTSLADALFGCDFVVSQDKELTHFLASAGLKRTPLASMERGLELMEALKKMPFLEKAPDSRLGEVNQLVREGFLSPMNAEALNEIAAKRDSFLRQCLAAEEAFGDIQSFNVYYGGAEFAFAHEAKTRGDASRKMDISGEANVFAVVHHRDGTKAIIVVDAFSSGRAAPESEQLAALIWLAVKREPRTVRAYGARLSESDIGVAEPVQAVLYQEADLRQFAQKWEAGLDRNLERLVEMEEALNQGEEALEAWESAAMRNQEAGGHCLRCAGKTCCRKFSEWALTSFHGRLQAGLSLASAITSNGVNMNAATLAEIMADMQLLTEQQKIISTAHTEAESLLRAIHEKGITPEGVEVSPGKFTVAYSARFSELPLIEKIDRLGTLFPEIEWRKMSAFTPASIRQSVAKSRGLAPSLAFALVRDRCKEAGMEAILQLEQSQPIVRIKPEMLQNRRQSLSDTKKNELSQPEPTTRRRP